MENIRLRVGPTKRSPWIRFGGFRSRKCHIVTCQPYVTQSESERIGVRTAAGKGAFCESVGVGGFLQKCHDFRIFSSSCWNILDYRGASTKTNDITVYGGPIYIERATLPSAENGEHSTLDRHCHLMARLHMEEQRQWGPWAVGRPLAEALTSGPLCSWLLIWTNLSQFVSLVGPSIHVVLVWRHVIGST